MNLIHRARNNFRKGDHALTYSFFRSLKPLMEKFEPDLAYFVLEGKQKHRTETYEGYKSNRVKQSDDFWRQQREILEVMLSLPIIQVRHPDHECDDVIANLAKYHTEAGNDVTIISGDSDFIQVFDSMDHARIEVYHPIKKIFIEKPDYTYLDWKALRGDVSDNIPGIKGVGDKTATKIIKSSMLMAETLSDPAKKKIFDRNKSLIAFHWFEKMSDNLETVGVEARYPHPSMKTIKQSFEKMGFDSMLTETYWPKFMKAFESLTQAEL